MGVQAETLRVGPAPQGRTSDIRDGSTRVPHSLEAASRGEWVAVPVLSHLQEAVASISVSGPTTRVDLSKIPNIVQKLQKASGSISERMGFRNKLQPDEALAHP